MGEIFAVMFAAVIFFLLGLNIWVIICGFMKHPLWGFACWFIPLAKLYFLVTYWDDHRKTGICYLSGWSIVTVVVIVAIAIANPEEFRAK